MHIKEIIKGCIEKDAFAQKALVQRYSGMLFTVCRRYVKDSHKAKDILQDSFIAIFDGMNSLKDHDALEGWMRRIVVHTSLRSFRGAKNKMEVVGIENTIEPHKAPAVFGKLGAETLIKLIQQLPNGYREVFNLYVIEEFSHKEIAKTLGIEESSSRSQLARARKILQKQILQKEKIAI